MLPSGKVNRRALPAPDAASYQAEQYVAPRTADEAQLAEIWMSVLNVERVGVLLDQRYIGTRDWYREGSELLLGKQEKGGRVERGQVETAFALLFWKRATVPARTSPLK